jgi:hypothetical protein
MASSVGDVVAQLQAVIERFDRIAIAAKHAQADAYDAHDSYSEAKQGTGHSDLNNAVTISREAAEKAGKVARLLAEASSSFATYLNTIAPGSDGQQRSPSVVPAGEAVVADAQAREERLGGWLQRISAKADDLEDTVDEIAESVGDGQKAISAYLKHRLNPGAGGQSTPSSAAPVKHHFEPAGPEFSVHDAAAALAVSALAMAVAAKAMKDHWQKLKGSDDDSVE